MSDVEEMDAPDPEHVLELEDGLWCRFEVAFQTPTGKFLTDIWARDFDHADEMLGHLKSSGVVEGQVYRTESHDNATRH